MSEVVYITGVAGFLGSNIAKRHLDAGDVVFGCDTFISSNENSTHLKRLKAQGLKFAVMDVRDPSFSDALACSRVNLIYNAACPASPPVYQKHPVLTTMTCVVGTKNVLDVARLINARVVHFSTSEVYGDPLFPLQKETDAGHVHAYGPRSCYDSGKMAAEALCYDYSSMVDVRIARIFNTYGPNMLMNDGRVVTNFVKQALLNENITIYGEGEQTRSFCYVDDLVDCLIRLGRILKWNNVCQPVNIGNPREFTMIELAQTVKKLIPESTSQIVHCDLPIHDPTRRCPNTERAYGLLGWKPRISLEQGLMQFIQYARETLKETP